MTKRRLLSRPLGRCIGLDVHLDFIEIAICEESKVYSAGRVPSTLEGIETLAESLLPSDRVALEVTGSSWEIVRLLEPHVSKVLVVSPGDTGISQARAKTDRLDARTLAKLLWSLLPSRNAESEPAPNPPSTMTTSRSTPARLTRLRQAPPSGADHPRPQTRRLTRTSSPGQPGNQSGAQPQNPDQPRRSMPHPNQSATPKVKDTKRPLDITQPFMDDIGATSVVPCGSEISVASRFRDALPSGRRAPDDGLVDPHPTTGGSDDFATTIRD